MIGVRNRLYSYSILSPVSIFIEIALHSFTGVNLKRYSITVLI